MSGYASLEKESILCQTENTLFLFIHPSIIYELPYIHQELGCMMKEVCIIFKDQMAELNSRVSTPLETLKPSRAVSNLTD